jgi:hypothetical protein
MCVSLATLDKLDRFTLPPGAPPIGDTSLTHVMRLLAHSTMYVTNAYCDGTIIYNDPVYLSLHFSFIISMYLKMFSKDDRTDMILLTHYFCDFNCLLLYVITSHFVERGIFLAEFDIH